MVAVLVLGFGLVFEAWGFPQVSENYPHQRLSMCTRRIHGSMQHWDGTANPCKNPPTVLEEFNAALSSR